MGSSQSSDMKAFIQSSVSVTMNVLNENVTNNHIECVAMNNMNLEFAPDSRVVLKKGSLIIGQKATVDACDMTSAVSTNFNNDFETKITNEINNMMEQQMKSTSGFLATSFSDQKSKSDFQSIVNTAISKTFRNSNLSTCAASARAINDTTILIHGVIEIEEGNIEITQEALVRASAKCVVDSVISNIDKTAVDSLVKNTQTQTLTTEIRGVFESLGAFFQQMLLPLIVCGVVTVILAIIYFMMKKGGNDPLTPKTP
jgi:hypothetical protein